MPKDPMYLDEVDMVAGGVIQVAGSGADLVGVTSTGTRQIMGVTPSHMIVYAGEGAYAGGGTSNAFTVTGVLSTDIVVSTVTASTNASYVVKAVPTTNTITVTFSADPGAATTVAYHVARAVV